MQLFDTPNRIPSTVYKCNYTPTIKRKVETTKSRTCSRNNCNIVVTINNTMFIYNFPINYGNNENLCISYMMEISKYYNLQNTICRREITVSITFSLNSLIVDCLDCNVDLDFRKTILIIHH